MRLLVPNARNGQAYSVIQSLRSQAERVVVVAERRWAGEQYLAHAIFAPGVDRWVAAPWPASDWERGHHAHDNTPAEAGYLAGLEALCCQERIDTIFPSAEGTIFVLAKNYRRLADRGVSVVCPPLEVVRLVNDKLRSMERLADAGIPIPRTCLPARNALDRTGQALGFPLVVKPRFASASRGVHVVGDLAELSSIYEAVGRRYGAPVLQEYIPGPLAGRFLRVIGVANATSEVLAVHVCRTLLTVFRDSVLPPAIARSEANPALEAATRATVKRLGISGPFLLQFKEDARDGIPKLIEANCKLSYRTWTAMADGLDIPRLVLDARGPGAAVPAAPTRVGTVFLNVPEVLLARCLRPGQATALRAILQTAPRVCDPYTAGFGRAPRVALVWWGTFLGFALKERLVRRFRAASRAVRAMTAHAMSGRPAGSR